ncbi:MAG: hypothetical protein AB7U82_30415 [Blastocatellales bacterium]
MQGKKIQNFCEGANNRIKFSVAAALLITISFFTVTLGLPAYGQEREHFIPVTKESYFFVDHATLLEPYDSLNTKLPSLELSRLLNERKRFPTMHFLLEGDRRVIAMRVLAEGKKREDWHSTWAEDLTLLLPTPLAIEPEPKIFHAAEIVGLYSTFGMQGRTSFMAFVATDGTVTVSNLAKDQLKVSVDLKFKRIDVDYSLYIDEFTKQFEEIVQARKKAASSHAVISFKKTFTAERKDYQSLSFWEGRAGDVDVKNEYDYCLRCFYDPKRREMWKSK